jgi:hypothetical protein
MTPTEIYIPNSKIAFISRDVDSLTSPPASGKFGYYVATDGCTYTSPNITATIQTCNTTTTLYAAGVGSMLGDGVGSDRWTFAPVLLPANSGQVVNVVASSYNMHALTSLGKVYSWGTGTNEIGDGANTARTTPVLIDISVGVPSRTALAIASGVRHTIILTSDNALLGFGENSNCMYTF